MYTKKNGMRRCFHVGSGSSCCMHLRQHYALYKQGCLKEGLEVHHWAIPRNIWKEMQLAKSGLVQQTLNSLLVKTTAKEFTKENLLLAITKFVAMENQVHSPY